MKFRLNFEPDFERINRCPKAMKNRNRISTSGHVIPNYDEVVINLAMEVKETRMPEEVCQ